MENRCRLCAEMSAELTPALEDMDLLSQIYHLFQVKIQLEDPLSTLVCRLCWEMVQNTWLFYSKVQKAQDLLTDFLNTVTVQDINIAFETSADKIIDCVISNESIKIVEEELEKENKTELQVSDVVNIEHKELEVVNNAPCPTVSKKRKAKKRAPKEDTLAELEGAEINVDGSLTPKEKLDGWESYIWLCWECQQQFVCAEDLQDHYTIVHSQVVRYSCLDCNNSYGKYATFINHIKTVHRKRLKFCCDICYKWYPTAAQQESHRIVHTEKRESYDCPACGKTFKLHSSLVTHSRTHLPHEVKNRYQCDQCLKRFGTKPNLIAHKRIHSGVKDYTCDQCGKSFVQKGNLDNHLLTHTNDRPFSCLTCAKTFKTLVRLRKHSVIHTEVKPHQCDICGRQFREKGTLKEHYRIHTGAMPFTCEFCGKSFRFKGVLTTHRRQHTGERPYSCNECQHHFTNWPNYNKHMKRRHGINTSVSVRKPQTIPPTGMPHRNPPGTVLAPPQPLNIPTESYVETNTTFYPVLNLYNIPEELLQQRV